MGCSLALHLKNMSKALLLLEVIFFFSFRNSGVICPALFINGHTIVVMG